MSEFINPGIMFLTTLGSVVIMKSSIDLWIDNKKINAIVLFIYICVCNIVIFLLSEIKMLLSIAVILVLYTWAEYTAIKKKQQEEKDDFQ